MSISDESIMDSSTDDDIIITTKRRRLAKLSDYIEPSSVGDTSNHPILLNIDSSDSESDENQVTYGSSLYTGVANKSVSCIEIDDSSESDSDSSDQLQLSTEEIDEVSGNSEETLGPFGEMLQSTAKSCVVESGQKEGMISGPFGSIIDEGYKSPPRKGIKHVCPHVASPSQNNVSSSSDSDNDELQQPSPPGPLTQLLTVNVRRNVVPRHPNVAYAASSSRAEQIVSHGSTGGSSDNAAAPRPGGITGIPSGQISGSALPADTALKPSRSVVADDLQQWRCCLWPSLASFYRVILRAKCVPDSPSPGRKGERNRGGSCSRTSDLHLEWDDFWDPSSLHRVGSEFDSVADHNRTFFLLLLEECRAGMSSVLSSKGDPRDRDELGRGGYYIYPSQSSRSNPRAQAIPNQVDKLYLWQRGEVQSLVRYYDNHVPSGGTVGQTVSVNSSAVTASSSDPRLGYLWVLKLGFAGNDENALCFSPGDLLAIRSDSWSDSRLRLGVVQGWDPDKEIVLRPREEELPHISLIVCMHDTSAHAAAVENAVVDEGLGGWFVNGDVCVGTVLELKLLGNTMTCARECQALSSLSAINPDCRRLILKPSLYCGPTESTEGASAKCPEAVPFVLWSALRSLFNDSQLSAITQICDPRSIEGRQARSSSFDSDCSVAGIARRVSPTPQQDSNSCFRIALLQGPPGTGKTHTVLGIIALLQATGFSGDGSKKGGKKVKVGASLASIGSAPGRKSSLAAPPPPKIRILLLAPSNTAVDELTLRLKTHGVLGLDGNVNANLKVVRVGQATADSKAGSQNTSGQGGNEDEIQRMTLDYLVENRKREMEQAHKKTSLRDTRGHQMLPRVPSTVHLRQIILEEADIVCCTLSCAGSAQLLESVMNSSSTSSKLGSGSSNLSPNQLRFDVVIIDEACQSTEPSALIPFKYNPKLVIMVGDPNQLPATVLSRDAVKYNYGQSLFERLCTGGYSQLMLEIQYRMHPEICEFPSREFYHGRLRNYLQSGCGNESGSRRGQPSGAAAKCSHWKPFHDDPSGLFRPVALHFLTKGTQELSGSSYYNRVEAEYILDLFGRIRKHYANHCNGGVGIIAAYKAQQRYLKKIFRERYGNALGGVAGKTDRFKGQVVISTVDGFQGREMDIIIFSCVRCLPSNTANRRGGGGPRGTSDWGIGFMGDWRRLNVAITRAKYGLWIVGDVRKLEDGGSVWRHLIEYCRMNRSIRRV